MTDLTRNFDLICFRVRLGVVHRWKHEAIKVPQAMNASNHIARCVKDYSEQLSNVLVLEDGCIKPDWSVMSVSAWKALQTLPERDYLGFIKNVEALRGLAYDEFMGHALRSFPNV